METTASYAGTFPRGRHSHRCQTCGEAEYCYKTKCTKPQKIEVCTWCNPRQIAREIVSAVCEITHLDATANQDPDRGKIAIETAPLTEWLRAAGRVTVIDEGMQGQLFGGAPVRMFRLYNGAGDSRQVDEDTARAYGLKPTAPKPTTKPQQSAGLFDTQEGLF